MGAGQAEASKWSVCAPEPRLASPLLPLGPFLVCTVL